jgi:hypothetical protein
VTTVQRPVDLRLLMLDIDDARKTCHTMREVPHSRAALKAAEQRLVTALEAYAAAVAARGLPLPHRLRVELIVYRSVVAHP